MDIKFEDKNIIINFEDLKERGFFVSTVYRNIICDLHHYCIPGEKDFYETLVLFYRSIINQFVSDPLLPPEYCQMFREVFNNFLFESDMKLNYWIDEP